MLGPCRPGAFDPGLCLGALCWLQVDEPHRRCRRGSRVTSVPWQGSRSELLGYTYSNMPGAFGPAYGVSPPSIKFHVTQQLPTGPHPMTTDALVTSNNAISFAHAVENTEREDKQRLEDVSAPVLPFRLPSFSLPRQCCSLFSYAADAACVSIPPLLVRLLECPTHNAFHALCVYALCLIFALRPDG